MKTIIIFSICITVTLYCSNAMKSISKHDQGSVITVALGTDLLIEMEANPSTGFGWETVHIDSSKILFKNISFIASDSLPGSGGMEYLIFKTVQKGESLLKLAYLRPWEGRGSMIDSFSVIVNVQ